MLSNVGFQLSYLAVLGIVFFQPLIANSYTAPNWFVHQIWSVTSVSLAAQLVTCPIGLLYFHQFPNCFLFSNLIIIPLTTLILYTGIFLLVVSKIGWLSFWIGKLLYGIIHLTNTLVGLVEHLPYAYTNGISISIFQSVLLYGVIIFITLFLLFRNRWFFTLCLCTCIVFVGLVAQTKIENNKQQQLVIYHINKLNAVQFIQGNQALFIADSALLLDDNKIKFHLQQHFWRKGIKQQKVVWADTLHWSFLKWNNLTVLFSGTQTVNDSLCCQTFIVKDNIDMDQVLSMIHTQEVIITSAVKPYMALKMLDICRSRKIDAQYVGEKGAIELSLLK
jgi:competence protein ComEC